MSVSMLNVSVNAADHARAACALPSSCPCCTSMSVHVLHEGPCPCCMFKSLHPMLFFHVAFPFYISMLHRHVACSSCMSCSMSRWYVHVNAAYLCPCCTYMSMLHVHVHAACPCSCCMSMFMLHVHVRDICQRGMLTVNVNAACPCSCCMPMSMLHVQINVACLRSCCMSMSMLYIHVSILHVHGACYAEFPCSMFIMHVQAVCSY
jgi:hypothetical protein